MIDFRNILYFSLVFLLVSCNTFTNKSVVYFGGKIDNPKNNEVVFYNTKTKKSDTLLLDKNNSFLFKSEKLEPNVYLFYHGGEYQMVLLEPGDSIVFKLNTFDFDESLVFYGKGARKNNFLIKNYLINETENNNIMDLAKLTPEKFSNIVEKRRRKKLKQLDKFLEKNPSSHLFESIAKATINYNAYADKEIYPFAYFGNEKLIHHKDLPENFYNFRKSVKYNEEDLSHCLAYNRFLFSHVDNLALSNYFKKQAFHSVFNRHSMLYNKTKLIIIDSLFKNKTIKNSLLKYNTIDFINNNHTNTEIEEFLKHYTKLSDNTEDIKQIQSMVTAIELLGKGHKIPNLDITDVNGVSYKLPTVITKPSIIYFWSSSIIAHYRNSHYKVKELKNIFPEIDFISININDDDDTVWKNILNQYHFPKNKEYKFKNSKKSLQTLALNYVNKAIIVDNNGYILHPNINIFSSDFETELTQALNNKKNLALSK